MIDELEWVRSERPSVEPASPAARQRARQVLEDAMGRAATPRRSRSGTRWLSPGNLAAAVALLVVLAVVAVFLGVGARRVAAPATQGGPELVFRAELAGGFRGVSRGAVTQAASLLQALISRTLGGDGHVTVTSAGTRVVVQLQRESPAERVRIVSLADEMGRLAFYDWEANATTSAGKSVASLLTTRNPDALAISQGDGSSAPGSSGAGSMALYPAARLAAHRAATASGVSGRGADQLFAFAGPSSPACAAAAHYYETRLLPTGHCYLAGPATTLGELSALLPPGVSLSSAQTVAVPAGTVVLEAVPAQGFSAGLSPADPAARFYVLADHPGLLGTSITNPTTGTDPSGSPDISFAFTPSGSARFSRVTAQISHRGDLLSGFGQTLDQHFAVALGDQLVTVPSIDFKTYPDGISGNQGADITGGFTPQSSQTALLAVRLGSLPLTLRLTSVTG